MATQLRQDFILGADGDFPLEDTINSSGKYLPTPYGNSDDQHKLDIIVGSIGGIKQFPLLGFNVMQYYNAEYTPNKISTALQNQMQSDGYKVINGCLFPTGDGFGIDTTFIIPVY